MSNSCQGSGGGHGMGSFDEFRVVTDDGTSHTATQDDFIITPILSLCLQCRNATNWSQHTQFRS